MIAAMRADRFGAALFTVVGVAFLVMAALYAVQVTFGPRLPERPPDAAPASIFTFFLGLAAIAARGSLARCLCGSEGPLEGRDVAVFLVALVGLSLVVTGAIALISTSTARWHGMLYVDFGEEPAARDRILAWGQLAAGILVMLAARPLGRWCLRPSARGRR